MRRRARSSAATGRPGAAARAVPARRSLPVRLLALSLAVCAVSVVATAWLVAHSIGVEQRASAQTLAKDRLVYAALVAYARDNGTWDGVEPVLPRLAESAGYRIVLTTTDGVPIADSARAGGRPDPVTGALDPDDARTVVDVDTLDPLLGVDVEGRTTSPVESTEVPVEATPQAVPRGTIETPAEPPVAPAALLYVTPPDAVASTFFDLSDRNRVRIASSAAAVLLTAAAVSLLIGRRMTRPLRALTAAADLMSRGDLSARVAVVDRDEIGAVASAFNAMASARERQESARRAMVSDVAHELRSPLSILRGQVEAAQDGLVSLDGALLASLHEESVTLARVVDDLQVLALADAGELRLHRESVDVRDLVEQHVTAVRPTVTPGVELTWAGEGPAVLDADPVRVRQVLGNLTSNALRHTPAPGKVHVDVRGDAHAVSVRVTDTGVGIPAEHVASVFERFHRVDPSRTRVTGGSGLGLAIVRDIVELHGGTVALTSEPERGTEVTFTLPA